jgi:hypothetical protein
LRKGSRNKQWNAIEVARIAKLTIITATGALIAALARSGRDGLRRSRLSSVFQISEVVGAA